MKFLVTGLTALILFFTAPAHADAGWNDFLKEAMTPPNALPNGSPCTGARQVQYSDTKRVAGGRVASESYREQVVQAHTRVTCYATWRSGDVFIQKPAPTILPSKSEAAAPSVPQVQVEESNNESVEHVDDVGDFQ